MLTKLGNAPFQSALDRSLNFEQFVRAVGLLLEACQLPLVGHKYLQTAAEESDYRRLSNNPLRESISIRYRSTADRRRLLFRVLAKPRLTPGGPLTDEDRACQQISVPFYKYELSGAGTGCIEKIEDERWVDVLDALVGAYPGGRLPTRDAFLDLIKEYPRQKDYLHQLHLQYSRLLGLLKLLLLVQLEDLGTQMQGFSDTLGYFTNAAECIMASFTAQEGSPINWHTFNNVIERNIVSNPFDLMKT